MAEKCARVEPTPPVDIDEDSVEVERNFSELTTTITWSGIGDNDWGTDKKGRQIDPTTGGCKYVLSWCEEGSEMNTYDVAVDACRETEEYTITELLAGAKYHFRIVAVNGNDDWCNTSVNPAGDVFKMIEPTPPADIDDDSVEVELDKAGRAATIKWNGIEDDEWGIDENGEQITPATAGNCNCKYVISWCIIGGSRAAPVDVAWDACHETDKAEYTITELIAGAKYHYIIEAMNGNDDEYNTSDNPAGGVFKMPRQRRKTSKRRGLKTSKPRAV